MGKAGCFLLAELLAGFSRSYPGIRLEVSEDSSVRLARRLESCAPELIERFEHRPAFYDHILLAVPQDTPISEELAQCAMSARDRRIYVENSGWFTDGARPKPFKTVPTFITDSPAGLFISTVPF